MSIKVRCQCGKTYSVRNSLAGKSARCKRCGSKIQIQIPEAVLILPAESTPEDCCPKCGRTLSARAVLCIDCGYNRQEHQQIHTVVRPDREAEPDLDSEGDKKSVWILAGGLALVIGVMLLLFLFPKVAQRILQVLPTLVILAVVLAVVVWLIVSGPRGGFGGGGGCGGGGCGGGDGGGGGCGGGGDGG